ncbi:cytochrome d terminal oxidase subunit 1 [Gammaproteobacteria bacterium SCGC AG-212-F23]|nr:cytochrome d terminal oxidase subunit 1 [Gammaproteobacteria bacterium SCGC AG-212-F23]
MISLDVVQLSRLQFGLTALYHFLFVPLTLGMSALLGIMETVYVITGRTIWRDMTKFWGILFGINFAMGVATGITLEFQFGTNWAYYAHYVGDVFGVPLAIEGLMAFFLEGTFIGLFFFGWNKLSKGAHLMVTWLVCLGSSLSALWILIANGWMQHPQGAIFNFHSMRMEVTDFAAVLFNPTAQAKFVHTISAGYVTGAVFILAISAYYLLRGRHVEIAKRSMIVAAAFGLASALSVVVLGDESGYVATENQRMKIAAMEGMWNTEPAPAALNIFGIPDQEHHLTRYEIKIPYLLGLIATRSISKPVYGINQLVVEAENKITRGMKAYAALEILQKNPDEKSAQIILADYQNDLGYGLLLKRYTDKVIDATPAQIKQAAWDTVPLVAPLFWCFRFMVAIGLFLILLFATSFVMLAKKRWENKWFLRTAFYSLPLPWIAAELGWYIAESGRQPWVIEGVLPTFLGTSSLSTHSLITSLSGFILLYTFLAVVEIYLMVKYIRLGPPSLENA